MNERASTLAVPAITGFGIGFEMRLPTDWNGRFYYQAKVLISAAYGKIPDRSYFAGCSSGGRHAMVVAARFSDQYDGILAGNPGFNLPKAAVAQLYGVQQYSPLATGVDGNGDPDISTALTADEIALISEKLLEQYGGLDRASDGIVADTVGCQAAFDLEGDVPT